MSSAPRPAGSTIRLDGLTSLTAVALALVQAALVMGGGSLPRGLAAGAIVLASVFVGRLRPGRRWPLLGLLAACALITLFADAAQREGSPTAPTLFAAVVYGYLSLLLATPIAMVARHGNAGGALTGLSTWVMLMVLHGVLAHLWPWAQQPGTLAWQGTATPHAALGEWYPPFSVLRTIYPTNPRRYFAESPAGDLDWALSVHDEGSRARLIQELGQSVLRVQIDQASVPVDWHVQLTRGGLALQRDGSYEISFRARADASREISVGVGEAHPPWGGLGWYRTFQVGQAWGTYTDRFTASDTDPVARITFNLGVTAVSVDLADVQVRQSSGASAFPERPPVPHVEYRMNSRGCRGPEVHAPPPPRRLRLLAVGDSFTLGVGVHEQDTFAAQLAVLLNADAARRRIDVTYDVVNCGVSGYATREERLMYGLQAPYYQPRLVLLTMVHNDERSWRSEVELGLAHQTTNVERAFLPWAVIQQIRNERRRPPADFTGSVRELLALDAEVRRDGGRLAVVIFRYLKSDAPVWIPLLDAVKAGLGGTDIPWIDLGPTIAAEARDEDLVVHPIDPHPNERAHRRAAEAIAGFLREQRLIE